MCQLSSLNLESNTKIRPNNAELMCQLSSLNLESNTKIRPNMLLDIKSSLQFESNGSHLPLHRRQLRMLHRLLLDTLGQG